MIAIMEKRRDTDSKGDDPRGAARRAEICRVTWKGVSSWQHVIDACATLRIYQARRFGLAAWREVCYGFRTPRPKAARPKALYDDEAHAGRRMR